MDVVWGWYWYVVKYGWCMVYFIFGVKSVVKIFVKLFCFYFFVYFKCLWVVEYYLVCLYGIDLWIFEVLRLVVYM